MTTYYRGTAIVITDKGILVGKERTDRKYSLPGGQCEYNNGRRESRKKTAIRELKEETGLEAVLTEEIGEVITINNRGQTNHKVYLIKAEGDLKMINNNTARAADKKEIEKLGFFSINKLNQPDTSKYQGHIYACLKKYMNEVNNKRINWRNFKSDINFK
ncbi:hypothetical protein COX58_00630 [archaeon CG_4_10_14_0_2_um_filter_Archaea_38_6]|nr:MAG: hypothetical protein COS83_04945 [archaeon CG07_land_8_20_14_0_80_38_8]PIU88645.1 MAG: hypothetical protein COS64_03355 [archaeon CG06_land_8_20_14_3_00_37_11]PJA23020.1 MAG: hypothetical protein COX58_00630 [archaeon CG_4_10_14_0_2_um_filter_Archaea_38_6]